MKKVWPLRKFIYKKTFGIRILIDFLDSKYRTVQCLSQLFFYKNFAYPATERKFLTYFFPPGKMLQKHYLLLLLQMKQHKKWKVYTCKTDRWSRVCATICPVPSPPQQSKHSVHQATTIIFSAVWVARLATEINFRKKDARNHAYKNLSSLLCPRVTYIKSGF